MRLRSIQPQTFSKLFDVLKDNVSDVLLHFHPDSIKIRAADHAHTYITYVNLFADSLEEYVCDRYQPININMPRLATVMKASSPDDILQMDSEDGKGVINIKIIDKNTNGIKFKTAYKTFNFDEEDAVKFPEKVQFNNCISMNSNLFYTNLKQLGDMEAEKVKIRQCLGPNGVTQLQLIGLGSPYHENPSYNVDEDTSRAPTHGGVVNEENDEAAPSRKQEPQQQLEEIEMTFPLKKLIQFAKAHTLHNRVGIHLDQKGFLILLYKIGVYGDLRFVVAASIDDDDDDDEDDDNDADEYDEQPNTGPVPTVNSTPVTVTAANTATESSNISAASNIGANISTTSMGQTAGKNKRPRSQNHAQTQNSNPPTEKSEKLPTEKRKKIKK